MRRFLDRGEPWYQRRAPRLHHYVAQSTTKQVFIAAGAASEHQRERLCLRRDRGQLEGLIEHTARRARLQLDVWVNERDVEPIGNA